METAELICLSSEHLVELADAKKRIEQQNVISKICGHLGVSVELAFKQLSPELRNDISEAVQTALTQALDWTIHTMDDRSNESFPVWHSVAAAVTGAAGGALGIIALPIELPLSTMIILRSIADIARTYGEDLSDPETRLHCLEVFSMGGISAEDDAAENGYYALRSFLGASVNEAAKFIAKNNVGAKGAPALMNLIQQIASKFESQVSTKVAATAVPIIGAAGGALINALFIDRYQDLARGHFAIRKLERIYGGKAVKDAYQSIALDKEGQLKIDKN